MTEAERVLAEVADYIHSKRLSIDRQILKSMTAPYLPKPDRLTVAARDVVALTAPSRVTSAKINGVEISIVPAIRAIIAREVAAAEPTLIKYYYALAQISECVSHTAGDAPSIARAALKGE